MEETTIVKRLSHLRCLYLVIWKERNARVFRNEFSTRDADCGQNQRGAETMVLRGAKALSSCFVSFWDLTPDFGL